MNLKVFYRFPVIFPGRPKNWPARLASFLRKQGKPGYDETITEDEKPDTQTHFVPDDLYDQAARIVVSSGQASISYLQRRLRVGFSRAARLVDMMEADGLVLDGHDVDAPVRPYAPQRGLQ